MSLIFPVCLLAQENLESKPDSPPPKPEVKPISSSVLQVERRKEVYNDVKGRLTCFKVGLELYKRVRIGIGYYDNFRSLKIPLEKLSPVDQTTRYYYSVGFAEMVVFRNFRWEIASSLTIGRGQIGITKFESTNSSGIRSVIKGANSQDYQFKIIFKPISWLGIGAGVGYRNTHIKAHPEYSRIYSLGFYDAGIKLFPGYLYKSFFLKDKLRQEEVYYQWRKEKRKAYLKKLLKHD